MAIKNYTTKIDAFTSLGEIQSALAKAGATKIMIDYEAGRPCSVSFALVVNGNTLGFMLPAPVNGTLRVMKEQKIKPEPLQAERIAWRNVRDWVLAQVALIESCDVSVEEVFLPYLTDRSGTTLFEAWQSGRLLLGGG